MMFGNYLFEVSPILSISDFVLLDTWQIFVVLSNDTNYATSYLNFYQGRSLSLASSFLLANSTGFDISISSDRKWLIISGDWLGVYRVNISDIYNIQIEFFYRDNNNPKSKYSIPFHTTDRAILVHTDSVTVVDINAWTALDFVQAPGELRGGFLTKNDSILFLAMSTRIISIDVSTMTITGYLLFAGGLVKVT